MTEQAVLSAIGEDRPGLVEEVSEFVFARGGTIGDSRMANLRGQFAIMMLVAGTAEVLEKLRRDLGALESQARVRVELIDAPTSDEHRPARVPYRLTGRALDQPGLVHVVAALLRSLDVNIESMDTTLEAAPVTGAPVFAMDLVLAVPVEASLRTLRTELDEVCDPLNIDWQLAAL
jgi:glycine cleavage system transcriptional repressor